MCKLILQLAGVYGFTLAALSLSNLAQPWLIAMLCFQHIQLSDEST